VKVVVLQSVLGHVADVALLAEKDKALEDLIKLKVVGRLETGTHEFTGFYGECLEIGRASCRERVYA
jgi:hypothetical protein